MDTSAALNFRPLMDIFSVISHTPYLGSVEPLKAPMPVPGATEPLQTKSPGPCTRKTGGRVTGESGNMEHCC
jgi:hypothetical protein